MIRLARRPHRLLHLVCMSLACAGIVAEGHAVAPWACLALHGLGWWSHGPESQPGRDTDFWGILRVSLGVVACLVCAGQHWVIGATGPEYLVLAAFGLGLEWVRPTADNDAKRG